MNIGRPYYVAKTSLNKLALLAERLETAILWQVGGGEGGPVGIGHANMDGTFRYSYQLSDGAGSLVSFAIPDPGNVISTFSDPPGVELIPLPGVGIDYHQYRDTVFYIGSGGCASGYSGMVCGFGTQGYVTWLFSRGGGAVERTPIFGLTAPDPPTTEMGDLVYRYSSAMPVSVLGPSAPTPEPPSVQLVGGGLVMIFCALASQKGKHKAGVNGSLLA